MFGFGEPGQIDIGVVVAVVSAIASLFAIVVSVRTSQTQRALSKQLAHEEQLLLFEQVRMQRDSDVIRWTRDCIDVLSACETYVEFFDPSVFTDNERGQHQQLCVRLSALIDEGRLHFPNQVPESKGKDKPVAYRGVRQHIIGVLVRAHDKFKSVAKWSDTGGRENALQKLNDYRRRFVSEAQIAIDPRRFIALKEMNELKRERGMDEQPLTLDDSLKKLL